MTNICKCCGKQIEILKENDKRKQFCNLSCFGRFNATKRIVTQESKDKTSKTIKEMYRKGEITHPRKGKTRKDGIRGGTPIILFKEKVCTYCKKQFISNRETTQGGNSRFTTTCSHECFLEVKRKNARGNKEVSYNGHRFDSQWEVSMMKFFETSKIDVVVSPAPILWEDAKGKKHKYFPDFFIPSLNLFVDPKNPIVIVKQREKLEIISALINLIYGNPRDLETKILEMLENGIYPNESPSGIEPETAV